MHSISDGTFVISHVARGQWSALEREDQYQDVDGRSTLLSSARTRSTSSRSRVRAARSWRRARSACWRASPCTPTGSLASKEIRAEPFAAQVQGGNVSLVAGIWVTDFLDECEVFPAGKWKDQVDAASGAFSKLAAGTAYLTDYGKWV